MGTLYYGDARYAIQLDDRVLAHLKIVILTKLRRNESFAFSWEKKHFDGSGHGTIWIHPALALHFEFAGSKEVPINMAWLEAMSECANRTLGLTIEREPKVHDETEEPTYAPVAQRGGARPQPTAARAPALDDAQLA